MTNGATLIYRSFAALTFGAWRSPVSRLLWEQEVVSSNLAAPTEGHLARGGLFHLA